MPVTKEDIQEEIEEKERELADLKAAHKVIERLDSLTAKSNTKPGSVTPAIGESGIINLDEVEIPGKPVKSGPSLLDDIRGLIERLGSQEFTVNHVDAVLKKMGKGSDAKHFKSRISDAIRKLTDEGVVTRSHKGAGSDPHRYRVANEGGAEKTGSESLPKGRTEPGLGSVSDQHLRNIEAAKTARKAGGT